MSPLPKMVKGKGGKFLGTDGNGNKGQIFRDGGITIHIYYKYMCMHVYEFPNLHAILPA